jgi:hypothetical protein
MKTVCSKAKIGILRLRLVGSLIGPRHRKALHLLTDDVRSIDDAVRSRDQYKRFSRRTAVHGALGNTLTRRSGERARMRRAAERELRLKDRSTLQNARILNFDRLLYDHIDSVSYISRIF